MKKILSLMLIAVFVFALCACANVNISVGSSENSSKEESSEASSVNGYVVCCYSEGDQSPVEGVTVQLCTDANCFQKKTDANGEVQFDVEAGEWDVHIDKVPEGYSKPAEPEVKTSATVGKITFAIPAAK